MNFGTSLTGYAPPPAAVVGPRPALSGPFAQHPAAGPGYTANPFAGKSMPGLFQAPMSVPPTMPPANGNPTIGPQIPRQMAMANALRGGPRGLQQ